VGAYPDGIKLGPDESLHRQYSSGRIVVVTTDGKLGKVECRPRRRPTLAFGPDSKTVYVMGRRQQNPPYKEQVAAIAIP
jgi:sugar lactone lactonase YvrE